MLCSVLSALLEFDTLSKMLLCGRTVITSILQIEKLKPPKGKKLV